VRTEGTKPEETSSATARELNIFSRNLNYVRDAVFFWPFVIFSIVSVASAFSPPDRSLALKCGAVAIVVLLLAKERLLIFFVALGFCAIQGAIWLIIRPWSWPTFLTTVLTGVPFLLANRVWRKPKLSYRLPRELGAVDILLGVASICGTLFVFWVVARH
jgi:hypothetical protein